MIRVLIVDDYWTVRQALNRLFKTADDMAIIAQADTGIEAVCLCMQHQPDVVLMDISMPELDGITATRLIRCLAPDIKVVILSGSADDMKAQDALRLGAHAFLSKSDPIDRIIKTVRTVTQSK
jgi:DNA-binding NarL/FixJ family response regulator